MLRKNSKNSAVTASGLRRRAEEFTKASWPNRNSTWSMGIVSSVVFNPGLEQGCPALQKYCRAYQQLGLADLDSNTMFAWHGTPTHQNIASICHYGFDPLKRKRQKYGTGEYYGVTAADSHTFSGNTDCLIVVQIIKGIHLVSHKPTGCHVVNNPNDQRYAFTLPVLVVSYGHGAPLTTRPIPWICAAKEPITSPFIFDSDNDNNSWNWTKNDGSLEPYSAQVSDFLERLYRNHQRGGPSSCLICPISSHGNNTPSTCFVNFDTWTQKNTRTGRERRVKKKFGPQSNHNNKSKRQSHEKSKPQQNNRKSKSRQTYQILLEKDHYEDWGKYRGLSMHKSQPKHEIRLKPEFMYYPARAPITTPSERSTSSHSESTPLLHSTEQTQTSAWNDFLQSFCCCFFTRLEK